MKKLTFLFALGIAFMFTSCSKVEKDGEQTVEQMESVDFAVDPILSDYRVFTRDFKNGSGEEQKVKLLIGQDVYSAINDEEKLKNMLLKALSWANWDVKNKMTYQFLDDVDNLVTLSNDGEVLVSIKGSAENSYGVRGELRTIIYFDTNGEMIMEGEYPKIFTI